MRKKILAILFIGLCVLTTSYAESDNFLVGIWDRAKSAKDNFYQINSLGQSTTAGINVYEFTDNQKVYHRYITVKGASEPILKLYTYKIISFDNNRAIIELTSSDKTTITWNIKMNKSGTKCTVEDLELGQKFTITKRNAKTITIRNKDGYVIK